MTIEATRTLSTAAALRDLPGVQLPGESGYDAARMPWNVAVDLRPAAVAYPASAGEVADVVTAARQARLRIARRARATTPGRLPTRTSTTCWCCGRPR